MNTPTGAVPRRWRPVRAGDLGGLARLGVDATLGVVNLVEAMHHTIASGAGVFGHSPAGRTSGITGMVYGAVRGSTRVVGKGLDLALDALARGDVGVASTRERETLLAVLNGVWGDHLVSSGNPLAITAALRVGGRALDLDAPLAAQLPGAGTRLVVLVHGLCMNDLQWARDGHDHGAALARDLGATVVRLHYNSGRHVSENGEDFADLLQRLVTAWPVPLQDLSLVCHSMGGLVARSACHAGAERGHSWPARLKAMAFLGTPHHGAPLERGGRMVDMLFGVSPYVVPFARLGKARSAGITDLRYGNVQGADWQGRDRHAQHHDDRRPTPLPPGVACFAVAATTGAQAGRLHRALVGDGLVPVASALGEHRNPMLTLHVPRSHRLIVTGANHWDLLSRGDVYAQLRDWLGPVAA